jgi:hypothetical protein
MIEQQEGVNAVRVTFKPAAGIQENISRGQALKLIWEERSRQDTKWGQQNHSAIVWLGIITEEVGEFAETVLHRLFGGPKAGNMKHELIQIAAVGVAMVQAFTRNDMIPDETSPGGVPLDIKSAIQQVYDDAAAENGQSLWDEKVLKALQFMGVKLEPEHLHHLDKTAPWPGTK